VVVVVVLPPPPLLLLLQSAAGLGGCKWRSTEGGRGRESAAATQGQGNGRPRLWSPASRANKTQNRYCATVVRYSWVLVLWVFLPRLHAGIRL
jgi:hypothetical protein